MYKNKKTVFSLNNQLRNDNKRNTHIMTLVADVIIFFSVH